MHNLFLFNHLYRVRFLIEFSTRMNIAWIANKNWNGLAFTTFILATFWLKLDVGGFKHNGVLVWDILPWVDRSIVVSFRSPWLQQQAFGYAWRRRSLQIEQIVTMMKTNCHHLHHVVSWVWKLLIDIKILGSIPSQSTSRAIQAMPQNQPSKTHTQESELSHTFNYIYKTSLPPLQGFYALEFISVITMSFEKYFIHHHWNDKHLIIEMLIAISQGDDWSSRSNNYLNCILKTRQPWLLYLLL